MQSPDNYMFQLFFFFFFWWNNKILLVPSIGNTFIPFPCVWIQLRAELHLQLFRSKNKKKHDRNIIRMIFCTDSTCTCTVYWIELILSSLTDILSFVKFYMIRNFLGTFLYSNFPFFFFFFLIILPFF